MNTELRYELKFILDDIELTRAMKWLYTYTSAQERYHKRKVNSLYFDDLNFTSVIDNLAGLPYRSKNRLRWYGEERNSSPFFEIKKRPNNVKKLKVIFTKCLISTRYFAENIFTKKLATTK